MPARPRTPNPAPSILASIPTPGGSNGDHPGRAAGGGEWGSGMNDAAFFDQVGTAARGADITERPSNPPPVSAMSGAMQSRTITVRRWGQSDDIFWRASETGEKLGPAFYRF